MADPAPTPDDAGDLPPAPDPEGEAPVGASETGESAEGAGRAPKPLARVVGHAVGEAVVEAGELAEDFVSTAVHAAVEDAEQRVSAGAHAVVDEVDEVAEEAVEGIERFDLAVDRQFDRLRGNAPVDRFMYTASALADFSLLWHLLGAARGVVHKDREAEVLRLSATLAVESALVNGAIKSVFKRSRPVPAFERPHHLRMPVTSSFPSGHASAAFCAATLLADGDRLAPVYYGLAAVVASSRVHVKIHHASDVLIGAGIGIALGRIVRRLVPLSR